MVPPGNHVAMLLAPADFMRDFPNKNIHLTNHYTTLYTQYMKRMYATYSKWIAGDHWLNGKWILRGYGVMTFKESVEMNNRVAAEDRKLAYDGYFGEEARMSYQTRKIL